MLKETLNRTKKKFKERFPNFHIYKKKIKNHKSNYSTNLEITNASIIKNELRGWFFPFLSFLTYILYRAIEYIN